MLGYVEGFQRRDILRNFPGRDILRNIPGRDFLGRDFPGRRGSQGR